MDDRFNTIAGWVLFAGIVALGSSIVASEVFHSERPEKMGYPIEGVVLEGEGEAEAEQPIAFYLASADPAKGQSVFNKCAACHNAAPGGPNQLWGPTSTAIMGAPLGAKPGFAYTDALKSKGGTWTWDSDERVAQEPQGLRSRHQDDVRRNQQPAGPRQPAGLAEHAGQQSAASRRAGCRASADADAAKAGAGTGDGHAEGREGAGAGRRSGQPRH